MNGPHLVANDFSLRRQMYAALESRDRLGVVPIFALEVAI